MKTNELREKFLKFFESKGHQIVASDSLVPKEDPTLLFTSAGMNQFKDQFIGRNVTYSRVATCQKCLRTADLERVGKTAYHHTFFEMLGNFSFGDYFKKEAISWAWEFMIGALKLPEAKLWVSVYKDDDEAYGIWAKDVGISEEKIVKLSDKDNFWPSNAKKDGPNGPCGPCSEIFYDYGKEIGCRKSTCSPACDCGRFVEVWNLVFTQFNRTDVDKLEPLSSKNIDTGMGLERLASVMQGVHSNFEIDSFKPIIDAIKKMAKRSSRPDKINAIADHIRAISFAILDGVMPSNEGRGYVVRKLIRTAFFHGGSFGVRTPFLYKLVFSVAKTMGAAYPEIERRHEDIASVIKAEEEFFVKNLDLDRAKTLYEEKFKEFSSSGQDVTSSSSNAACFMIDTYGIPLEITEEIAKEKGHIHDKGLWDANNSEVFERRSERSRRKSAFLKETIFAETETLKIAGSVQKTEFIGHQAARAKAKVIKIFKGTKEVEEIKKGANVQIILDKTPFYAESGGQVGDSGVLKAKGIKVEIIDTKRIDDINIHIGKLLEGSLHAGDQIEAEVDKGRRGSIEKNHTATHLLQAALRKVLGEHVHQSGSVVDENRLRFDFTHSKKLSPRELERIEDLVNENIQHSETVEVRDNVELKEAVDEGAIALFGEKYGKHVRVVGIGGHSRELCGGTHVARTSDIRLFKIISEGSVAAGLRRIEAVTDREVDKYVIREEAAEVNQLKKIASVLEDMLSGLDDKLEIKKKAKGVLEKTKKVEAVIKTALSYKEYVKWEKDTKLKLNELVGTLQNLEAKLEKKIFSSKLTKAKSLADQIIKNATKVGDALVVAEEIKEADPKILRSLADNIKSKITSGIIVLVAQKDSRISFVCAVTPDLIKKGLHAGNIVKEMATITSGGGGGREDFAMAGGKDTSKLAEALDYVHKHSKEELEK